MREQVAIIGAGVSGLTCGVLFAERGFRTAIFAEETGAHTISSTAAAIWFPYDAEPADAVIEWALRTYDVLREMAGAPGTGVSMLELRSFSRGHEIEIPAWADSLGAERLPASAPSPVFRSGYRLRVPLTDTTRYLDYLTERFRTAGGEINGGVRLQQIEDVREDCDLIVNCSGIGAATLVPDPEMEAHRGQVAVVAALDLAYAVVCNDPPLMYAIPRAHDCVFGGTNHVSNDRAPDPAMTAGILAECSRVLNIDPPKILAERVGLRPFRRAGICLHAGKLSDGRRVIHNYGHGGSGFTLSWGCAQEVLALATCG